MNEMALKNGNLDRSYVDTLLLGQVKCDHVYGINNIIQTVKDQLGFDISYAKAWYSLKMAREKVYGTWESSVRKLSSLMGALQKWNLGTVVEWEHKGFQRSSGAYVIKYVFWAFKPCIEGFQFCRKVISVDGTHLYTKNKYKMLIAAAMDGNQHLQNDIMDREASLTLSKLPHGSVHVANGVTLESLALILKRMTYSIPFKPIMDEEYWDVPKFQLVHDSTRRKSTRPGRQQSTRIPNEMD
ncbi:UNVERIFIED_CONTAM: hypothetical protein Slati_1331200 [Sesamum latifolium]|uniref:Transposase n=1 Tax=Sesamum latifolium TaxID=2727402 RepID=A0AAW2XID2_9LAMI